MIYKSPLELMNDEPMDPIFDLGQYPIQDLENPASKELIAQCQEELKTVGCAVIRNFVKAESLQRMLSEADRLMDQTYWASLTHNPYFTKEDHLIPEDHPKRFFQNRSSGFINSDLLEEESDLNKIFYSKVLLDFISECLQISPLYCWADPLGNHPYSVMDDEHYFPWHFDGNDFTVSILVQQAEQGGDFEYVPNIRRSDDENFEGVNKILNGFREGVQSLSLRPGDMQIFMGRYSIHRVTKVSGRRKRIIALPTYSTDPLTMNRPEHSKQIYGRALPIHYEREAHRIDTLTD